MTDDRHRLSRRARILLYLGEGITVGGVLAAIGTYPLLGANRLLTTRSVSFSTVTIAVIVVFAIVSIRRLGLVAWARRYPRDRSPVERDWRETREWRWVIVVALLTFGAALGVSIALWGWERVASSHVGRWPAIASWFAGVVLLFYNRRRFGVM